MRPAPLCRMLLLTGLALAAPIAFAADPSSLLVAIPGSTFTMGDLRGEPDEAPREVTVGAFELMRTEVTNALFADFIARSGRVTEPERRGFGYVWTRRWQRVAGADWRHPFGPDSGLAGREQHPVLQISVRDAEAFCRFHGLRLPDEAEWELAARGSDARTYPWGDGPPGVEGEALRANFGTIACCAPDARDGYRLTAPVGSFPLGASPFGLLDMAGNVWEWTSSPFPGKPDHRVLRGGGWGNNPYCLRTSYRHGNPPDIGPDARSGIRREIGRRAGRVKPENKPLV